MQGWRKYLQSLWNTTKLTLCECQLSAWTHHIILFSDKSASSMLTDEKRIEKCCLFPLLSCCSHCVTFQLNRWVCSLCHHFFALSCLSAVGCLLAQAGGREALFLQSTLAQSWKSPMYWFVVCHGAACEIMNLVDSTTISPSCIVLPTSSVILTFKIAKGSLWNRRFSVQTARLIRAL